MAADRVNNLLSVKYWRRGQETAKGYLLCGCTAHFGHIWLNAGKWVEDVLSEPGKLKELSALRREPVKENIAANQEKLYTKTRANGHEAV